MRILIALPVALGVLSLAGCSGDRADGTTSGARQDGSGTDQGRRQFLVSCSGCHGEDARGNGPIAPILNIAVPDLTLIAARRGGEFPADEIYRIIDGQADLSAHGPRHMPVWGYEFFGDDPDDELAHREASEKIERLSAYLASIQRAE